MRNIIRAEPEADFAIGRGQQLADHLSRGNRIEPGVDIENADSTGPGRRNGYRGTAQSCRIDGYALIGVTHPSPPRSHGSMCWASPALLCSSFLARPPIAGQ